MEEMKYLMSKLIDANVKFYQKYLLIALCIGEYHYFLKLNC